MHGTRSIAVIGRYKQEIVKEGDGYAIALKVDQVGLITMLSFTLFYPRLPPTTLYQNLHFEFDGLVYCEVFTLPRYQMNLWEPFYKIWYETLIFKKRP